MTALAAGLVPRDLVGVPLRHLVFAANWWVQTNRVPAPPADRDDLHRLINLAPPEGPGPAAGTGPFIL